MSQIQRALGFREVLIKPSEDRPANGAIHHAIKDVKNDLIHGRLRCITRIDRSHRIEKCPAIRGRNELSHPNQKQGTSPTQSNGIRGWRTGLHTRPGTESVCVQNIAKNASLYKDKTNIVPLDIAVTKLMGPSPSITRTLRFATAVICHK